jgi:hypothetical protein
MVYFQPLRGIWCFAVSVSALGLLALLTIRKTTLSKEDLIVKTGLEAEEERRRLAME